MPYVKCPGCRLTTYCVRGALGRAPCPECGATLDARRPAPAEPGSSIPSGPVDVRGGVERALALAQRELRMDVAVLTEERGEREVVRGIAGNPRAFGIEEGLSLPVDETYCGRLFTAQAEAIVADARRDERVRDLDVTGSMGIGAYIGVRMSVQDARAYILCCLARESRPKLGERDLRFLRGLSASVAVTLGSG